MKGQLVGDIAPTHTTIQNFILRFGLHELRRVKEKADDWIWLMDHTIQGGTTLCLIVLGIRQSDFRRLHRPLEHQDMQVLQLLPVSKSNGEIVYKQCEELIDQLGCPLAILSDQGSDLVKGVRLLREKHSAIISLNDIVHATSRGTEKFLKNNKKWASFRQACCTCANRLRQSRLAHLKPPRPKTKARYMNIKPEIDWAGRSLQLLDRARAGELTANQQQSSPLDGLEDYVGWLDEYRVDLKQWQAMIAVKQQICNLVRKHGYGGQLMNLLESAKIKSCDEEIVQFTNAMLAICQEQCERAITHEGLPASTEVLESLIGKGKWMADEKTTGSITRQILALAAAVATPTIDCVKQAMATCRIKHLKDWTETFIGKTTHALRRQDLLPVKKEQNLRNQKATATPIF